MRKIMTVPAAVAGLLGVAVASPALTGAKPATMMTHRVSAVNLPPDTLLCDPADNGGTLVNGVCKLPSANLGQGYEAFIITSRGSGGTFHVAAGSLPPGTSMPAVYGAAGTIVAGTPTREGTFKFTVKGTDGEGQPLKQAYSIAVGPALPLVVSPLATGFTLPAGVVGTSYAQDFFATGGVHPYTWSLASGTLPPGLALVSSGAPGDSHNELAGTPSHAGTFKFTMKVTDSAGARASHLFTLTIKP